MLSGIDDARRGPQRQLSVPMREMPIAPYAEIGNDLGGAVEKILDLLRSANAWKVSPS